MQLRINKCRKCGKQAKEYFWDFCKECMTKIRTLDEINTIEKFNEHTFWECLKCNEIVVLENADESETYRHDSINNCSGILEKTTIPAKLLFNNK